MTAAYFEDHPTDPEKVILRKPRLDQGPDYERGFIDGMQHQMQSSVDKAVNRMATPKQKAVAWKLVPVEPTEEMLKAMDECSKDGYDERLYAGHAASVYMAAVDVAPALAQVSPLEFVTMTLEKEHLVGKPIFWAQWPNEEKSNG